MASIRDQIIDAAVAVLEESGGPAGLTVHRYRTRPLEADALPALVVYPSIPPGAGQSERVQYLDHSGGVERTLSLRVECRVDAGSAPPDKAVDPLYVWTVKQLLADPTLGGLVRDIAERSVAYDAVERDSVYAACAVDFEVNYTTSEFDPEAGV